MLLCRLKVDLPPTHSVRGWRLFSDPFFSKLGQTDTCTQWGKSSPVGLRLGAHRDGGSWLLLPQQQAAGLQKHSLPRGRQRSLRWRCGEDWWGLGYLRKARCCCTPDSEGLQTVERNSCQKKHFSFFRWFFFFHVWGYYERKYGDARWSDSCASYFCLRWKIQGFSEGLGTEIQTPPTHWTSWFHE